MKFLSRNTLLQNMPVIIIVALFILISATVSVHRFWQFEIGYYDFGIYDSTLWNLSRFQAPVIDHFVLSGRLQFADHLAPSFYLFSIIYWFTSRPEAILITQAILVGLSGIFVFLGSKRITKNELVSHAILIGYMGFIGLHNAVFFDIHPITFMVFFLSMCYWSLLTHRKKLFIASFLLTIGFQENLFALGFGIGVFTFFYKKEWRKLSILLMAISLLWGFLSIKVIIPYFGDGRYNYTLVEKSLSERIADLYTPSQKIETVLVSMFNFIALPSLAFELYVTMLFHYVVRFLSPGSERWGLAFHYNAEIAPTLAIAASIGYVRLQKMLTRYRLSTRRLHISLGVAITLLTVYFSYVRYRTPLYLAFIPDFYTHSKTFDFLREMTRQVPKDVSVMAQNNILGQFTHQKTFLIRLNYEGFNPDYILFDLRPGQNPAHVLEDAKKPMAMIFAKVKEDSSYSLLWNQGDQYVFKRND